MAHRSGFCATGRKAFTIMELLIVITLIFILAGLVASALTRAKSKAKAIHCLNNERQLTLACFMFVDEHEDYFPYNFGYSETEEAIETEKYSNWANNVLNWELESYNTNSALLTRGGLGPYNARVCDIYRCPSDSVLSDLQQSAGWKSRVRSYSLNAMVGNAGEFTASGSNTNNPGYVQFFKSSQIGDPSRIFLFIEEHPDSIDDGYFLNRIDSFEWTDLPASYHEGAANISFADGHVERHAWQFPSTIRPPRPDGAKLPFPVPANERGDFQWLMEHTSVKAQ